MKGKITHYLDLNFASTYIGPEKNVNPAFLLYVTHRKVDGNALDQVIKLDRTLNCKLLKHGVNSFPRVNIPPLKKMHAEQRTKSISESNDILVIVQTITWTEI